MRSMDPRQVKTEDRARSGKNDKEYAGKRRKMEPAGEIRKLRDEY